MALLPSNRALTLLTRHSVREEPANGVATYDLPLTPEGVALAEQWGQQWRLPVHGFYSSPVGRCVDTATALARGAGTGLAVKTSTVLVEPGCYVQSIGHVGPLFLQLGPVEFANRHLRENMKGILSPEEGGARLLTHLHEHQGPVGSLSVHVTHDTILAAFIYHLLGRDRIHKDDWPWMLEGAWIWFDTSEATGNTVHWIWRGSVGHRSIKI
jgi:broad specificity phosphatase PhoE